MSEQMSLSTGGGLLSLNISVPPQSAPVGGAAAPLFNSFGSLLNQQGQGGVVPAAFRNGASLPPSGEGLPQESSSLLPENATKAQLLQVAYLLEQVGDPEAVGLPPGLGAELAKALKQYSEQEELLPESSRIDLPETAVVSSLDDADAISEQSDNKAPQAANVEIDRVLLEGQEPRRSVTVSVDPNAQKRTPDELVDRSVGRSPEPEQGSAKLTSGTGASNVVDSAGSLLVDAEREAVAAKPVVPTQPETVKSEPPLSQPPLTQPELKASSLSGEPLQRSPQVEIGAGQTTERAVLQNADSSSGRTMGSEPAVKPALVAPGVVQSDVALANTNRKAEVQPAVGVPVTDREGELANGELMRAARATEKGQPQVNIHRDESLGRLLAETQQANVSSGRERVSANQNFTPPMLDLAPKKIETALDMTQQLMQKIAAGEKVDTGLSQAVDKVAEQATAALQNAAQPTQAQKNAADAQTLMMPGQVKINTPAWKNALGERAIMIAAQSSRVAEIKLDPPELGSLQVRISVNQDQVSLNFTSPHAHVRDAVEQSLPRLREMFAEQGLALQDSSVSDQSSQQQREEMAEHQGAKGDYAAQGMADDQEVNQASGARTVSLVDYYA